MEGNPTGCMGLADYLGWDWRSKAGLPIVNVPGCPVQPDNFMETVLVSPLSGRRPGSDDSVGRSTASHMAFRRNRTRRLRSSRLLRAGRFRGGLRFSQVHRETRMLGAGRQLQCPETRMDGGNRRLPKRRRHLHRLHHARLPGQVHAIHGRAAGRESFYRQHRRVWPCYPVAPRHHAKHVEQGTQVAASEAGVNHRVPSPILLTTILLAPWLRSVTRTFKER